MKKYINGLDMKQFKCLEDISFYNNNYYVGFNRELLYAKSDDDDTTEWYLVLNNNFYELGYSLTSEGNKLHTIKTN